MSAHKDHYWVEVSVKDGTTPPIVVLFRWRWQAWLVNRLIDRAVGAL